MPSRPAPIGIGAEIRGRDPALPAVAGPGRAFAAWPAAGARRRAAAVGTGGTGPRRRSRSCGAGLGPAGVDRCPGGRGRSRCPDRGRPGDRAGQRARLGCADPTAALAPAALEPACIRLAARADGGRGRATAGQHRPAAVVALWRAQAGGAVPIASRPAGVGRGGPAAAGPAGGLAGGRVDRGRRRGRDHGRPHPAARRAPR